MTNTIIIAYDAGSVNITLLSHRMLFTDLLYGRDRSQDTIHVSVTGTQDAVERLLKNQRVDYKPSRWDGYLERKQKVDDSIAVLELLVQLLPRAKSLYWLWIKNLHDVHYHTLTPALQTYLWNSACRPVSLKMKRLKIKTGDIAKFVDYLERRLSIITVMKDGTPLKSSSYALYLYEAVTQWYEDFCYNLDSNRNAAEILRYFEEHGQRNREVLHEGRRKVIYPPLIQWIADMVPSTEFCTFDLGWRIATPSGRSSPWSCLDNFHVQMDEHISTVISSDDALTDQSALDIGEDAGKDVEMGVILRSFLYDTPLLGPHHVNVSNRCASGLCHGSTNHLSQATFMLMLRQWLTVIAHHPRSEWNSLTAPWRSCAAVDAYLKHSVAWVAHNFHSSEQHKAFAVFAHELGYWSPKRCHKTKQDCLNTYPQSASSYELDDHMFAQHKHERD